MMCSTISTAAPPQRSTVRRGISMRLATAAGMRGQPGRSDAHEDDPLPRLGRAELDADIASAPVADAFDRRRAGYRSLIPCYVHPKLPVIHD